MFLQTNDCRLRNLSPRFRINAILSSCWLNDRKNVLSSRSREALRSKLAEHLCVYRVIESRTPLQSYQSSRRVQRCIHQGTAGLRPNSQCCCHWWACFACLLRIKAQWPNLLTDKSPDL